MSSSMSTWKRVTLSLQGLVPGTLGREAKRPPRPLRLERLMPRNLLAADAGPAALQYTAGATLAGEVAEPFGWDSPWQDPGDDAAWWDAAAGSAPDHGALTSDSSDDGGAAQSHLMMAAAPTNAAASYGGVSSGATLLDSECAALEILISLLEGQLQSMYDAQAASDNPGYGGMLQDQIDAVQASLASAYETLATLDCEASGSAGGSSSDPWDGGTDGATFGDADGMSQWGSDAGASDGASWWATSGSDTAYSDGYSAPDAGGITGFSDGDSWFDEPGGASDGASDAGYSWGAEDGSGPGYGTTWDSDMGASGGGSAGSEGDYDAGDPGDGDPGSWSDGMSGGSDWGESGGSSDSGNDPPPSNLNGNYAIENLKAGPAPYAWNPTPGTVPEGQYLHVTGRAVVPPFAPQNSTLVVQADTNFDGQFDLTRETFTITIPAYGDLEPFDLAFWIPDDGPAPGNGTSSDTINVRATLNDDIVATTSATILNVAPHIASRPTLTTRPTEDGNQEAVVTVTFFDPGATDKHTVTVRWGDGTETIVTEDLSSTEHQPGYCPTKTIVVTRPLTDDAILRPATITVSDDDGGKAIYQIGSLDVALNNDDDNENSRPDYQEAGFPQEDDLVELSLAELLNGDTDWDSGTFHLIYDHHVIRIWDSESKTTQILPTIVTGDGWTLPTSTGIPYTGQETVWVEGISIHTTTVSLLWQTDEVLGAEDHGLPTLLGDYRVTVWGIDLDIDSDNNNGFDLPDNSDWEEHIEDHDYAIGKMVYPNTPQFTPVRLRLNRGLDPSDSTARIRLDFEPVGKSGVALLWNTPASNTSKIDRLISAGGNRVAPNTPYTLADLNYDPASGGITLYIESISSSNRNDNKKKIETLGKPVDRLVAVLELSNQRTLEDAVRYMIVKPDSFYPHLNANPAIRAAMASEGVYDKKSLPNYALELIDISDIAPELAPYWPTPASAPGIGLELYFDYVSGSYLLAFAGTDSREDWVDNYRQNFNIPSQQYISAMDIAYRLDNHKTISSEGLYFTGHSLGGGLASAAALTTARKAYTFNSAGLRRETLDDSPDPNAKERFPYAPFYIDAHYLDTDILSAVQDSRVTLITLHPYLMPPISTLFAPAVGRRILMDGPLTREVNNIAQFSPTRLSLMAASHKTEYYHFGLLVNERTGWDIYGIDLPLDTIPDHP